MLPASFQVPAALVLIVAGLVSCFAGYRVFRIVLGIYGFIFGAMFTSGLVGPENTLWMVGAALIGGIVGALILILAYFVGVALIGAAIGAGLCSVIWAAVHREPGALTVIVFAIAGALTAMALQRYVMIGATAFIGAWTALVGAAALLGDRQHSPKPVWLMYPFDPLPELRWFYVAALVLGLIGIVVQLRAPART